MGSIYVGRVMRIDQGGPVIRVPLLGRDALWGPVSTVVGGLRVDEQIIVGQLGSSRDQLVILGRLDPEGLSNATARLIALEAVVADQTARLVSAETGIARLATADHATGITLRTLRERLSAIENAATALPTLIDSTGDNSAAVVQLQSDVTLLRQDLGAAQSNIAALQSNQSDILLRVGALEAWKAAGGGGGGGGGTPTAPTKPGELLKLTRWELTLPTGPSAGNPDDIYAGGSPNLTTYSNASYFRLGSDSNGYYVECAAPVTGSGIVTTSSASGASRSELREMATDNGGSSGTKASWTFADGVLHEMIVTMSVDPSSIVNGRQEIIIGQIHGTTGTPPLYLACNFNSTKKLTLFKNGASAQAGDFLSGSVDVGTMFSYRMAKTAAGRVQFSYALGGRSALPATPQWDWPVSDFTDNTGCYFKIGAYNKTPIDDADATGVGRTRLYGLSLDGVPTGGTLATPTATALTSLSLDTIEALTAAEYAALATKPSRTGYLVKP